MSDDDDELHDFDLSAWDAPEAPAGLADAVIARMGVPQVASDLAMATAIESARNNTRRRMVIAGVATGIVAAAAGAWLVVRDPRAPHDDELATGALIADRARHLDLETVSGDLDLGADVRWRPSSDGLRVEQRAGAATWRVAAGHQLVIDAASVTNTGAAASIEASGASLRVEIQPMNMSDARMIGASALTSAAVALITVVVYEGHVKATSAGQTVIVQPGSSVEIKPDRPPVEPLHVGLEPPTPPTSPNADLEIMAGESVTIHDHGARTTVHVLSECKSSAAIAVTPTPATAVQPDGVITLTTGHYRYEVRCDGSTTAANAGTIAVVRDLGPELPAPNRIDLDGRRYNITYEDAIPQIVVKVRESASRYVLHVDAADEHLTFPSTSPLIKLTSASLAPKTYTLSVELDGKRSPVTSLMSLILDPDRPVARIREPSDGDTWSSPVHVSGDTIPGAVVTVDGRGVVVNSHSHFAADLTLASTTLAIRIVHPQRGIHYYIRRARTETVDKTAPPADCDSEALRDAAMELESRDEHAKALAKLEQSLACNPNDARTVQLAFMAACNKVDYPAAHRYYKRLSAEQQSRVVAMCIRNHITKEQLDAVEEIANDDAPTAPANCDADALRDRGAQDEAMGQHTKAIADFKEALACRPDEHVLQLLFMAACNGNDFPTAHKSYKQLPTGQQEKVVVMCIRNHITRDRLDAPLPSGLPPASADAGTLHVMSKPPAEIYIDGIESGLMTPITGDQLRLEPGKHKVMFVVGEDRYTFPVRIETGKTATLSKDL